MWSVDLPPEIFHDILLRLPVKTLIKCTALSKHYHSLITNPKFIAAHMNNNNPTTQLLLRYWPGKPNKERFFFEPDDDNFSGFNPDHGIEVPFVIWGGGCFNILGSINGVICLVNDSQWEGTQFILWNPSIREYVELPKPQYTFQAVGGYESVSGFMFDPVNNDFKVVRIVDVGPEFYDSKQVEVFSLRSGCWRDLGTVDVRYRLRNSASGYMSCFLHGCVNWVVFYRMGPAILKFDMSTEGFEFMKLPSCFKGIENNFAPLLFMHVQEFKGKLGLVYRDFSAKTCCLWVMKEYGVVDSWTKILDLNVRTLHPSAMPRAFGQRKFEEILMVKGVEGYVGASKHTVVSTNSTHNWERNLGEVTAEYYSFQLCNYVESMALFGEGKRLARLKEQCNSATKEEERT